MPSGKCINADCGKELRLVPESAVRMLEGLGLSTDLLDPLTCPTCLGDAALFRRVRDVCHELLGMQL